MEAATAPVPQHLESLTLANTVRSYRARVKRQLAAQPDAISARRAIADLLADPPEQLLSMRIFDLLRAGYSVGHDTARRSLRRARVSELATVEGLTERQRLALVGALKGSA